MSRSVADGRFQVPTNWPKWKKTCGVVRRGRPACKRWAVVGMPTCKYHGSGGKVNAELGQLRYLAWVVTGGPQNMPVEHACRLAFAVFAEAVLKHSTATTEQQYRAALWLTQVVDTHT